MGGRVRRALPAAAAAVFAVWTGIALAHPGRRPPPRVIPPREPIADSPKVTFSRDISRLLQAHCQACHHEGGIAPFPLVTYPDALAHKTRLLPRFLRETSRAARAPWGVPDG